MIYEIRNYYFEPKHFEAYKRWANDKAVAYLKENLNVLGFWVNADIPPEIQGQPMDDLGSANVTWIIGWEDIGERPKIMGKVFQNDTWREIFSQVPGGRASYIRREAKFAEAV